MYRDELEAQRARLTTLEEELAGARQRRRELEARAAAARQARHQARRALEGKRPGRGLRWLAAGLALALSTTLIFGIDWIDRQREAASSAGLDLVGLKQRSEQLNARIATVKRELEAELRRCVAVPASVPGPLGRSEIQAAMQAIKPAVQACYDRHQVKGTVFVTLTINTNGAVSATQVRGMFTGTPTATCLEQAVRDARFPAFKGAPITIDFPFILR